MNPLKKNFMSSVLVFLEQHLLRYNLISSDVFPVLRTGMLSLFECRLSFGKPSCSQKASGTSPRDGSGTARVVKSDSSQVLWKRWLLELEFVCN